MIVLIIFACQPSLKAPSCTEEGGFSCFRGVFRTLLGAAVEGVELCAPEHPELECVLSDQEGGWTLPGLPRDSDIYLTAVHNDYASSLFPQHTSMAWYDWYKVAIPKSVMETNASQLDLTIDDQRGQLLFLTWEGLNIDGIDTENVVDVTASSDAELDTLFYGNILGLASSSQAATSSSGSGGMLNLPPGELSLQLQAPAGVCAQEHMFHFHAEEGVIPVPIRAGFTTAIDVICPIN